MRETVANLIQAMLRAIGIKSIDKQYLFSYALIFLCAVVTAVSLYLSIGSSANGINVAGRQRMLSQRVAKEALMVTQGIVNQSVLQKTIALFESSHQKLLNGDKAAGIAQIKDKTIRAQLKKGLFPKSGG